MNFENKLTTAHGIRYSRYIASWIQAKAYVKHGFNRKLFLKWLEQIGVDHAEAVEIHNMATDGKFELEESIRKLVD